jgi:hypothetical protein
MDAVTGLMRTAMHSDEDYGVIPGTKKPTLLKPGAEKLCLMFRLSPKYEGEREPIDLGNGHREYVIKCDLFNSVGEFVGSGLGSCSTMESKYRWRTGPRESTGKPVPKDYWDKRNSDPKAALALIGGVGFCVHKGDSGVWEVCIQGERVENPDIADVYNTVLKMAKKRAYVDAVLSRTAASQIFTQDLEDMHENAQSRPGGSPAPEKMQMPSEKAPAPAATAKPSGGGTANDKQKNYIKKLAKEIGLEEDAQRHAITAQLCNGKESTNDLSIGEASTLIDALLAVKNGKTELIFKPDGTPVIELEGGKK